MDVTVTTPNGTSAISTKDHFTFLAPVVAGLSPSGGPTAGGTAVTATGSGFALGATGTIFRFGKTRGSAVSCTSTGRCTVLAPAGGPGTVEVTATVNKQNSKKNPPADQFTYH